MVFFTWEWDASVLCFSVALQGIKPAWVVESFPPGTSTSPRQSISYGIKEILNFRWHGTRGLKGSAPSSPLTHLHQKWHYNPASLCRCCTTSTWWCVSVGAGRHSRATCWNTTHAACSKSPGWRERRPLSAASPPASRTWHRTATWWLQRTAAAKSEDMGWNSIIDWW